jgi:hypothetical protein
LQKVMLKLLCYQFQAKLGKEACHCLVTLLQHKVGYSGQWRHGCWTSLPACLHCAPDTASSSFIVQDTVVNKLQQPCQGPSLPVENVGQAALIEILQRAAMQPNGLQPINHNLEWALQFRDKPACWYVDGACCFRLSLSAS